MSSQQVGRHAAHAMSMYQVHLDRGWTPEQAAGWAANAEAESRGNYKADQTPGPGYGLFQWGANKPSLDRRITFEKVFGHPIQQSTEAQQLAFRDWELKHSYAPVARGLAKATTAGDASAIITRGYEGPKAIVSATADRANIAEAIIRLARHGRR